MAQNIKNKIRNLLALAESPNENEAKVALLKARELMAKHKLTESSLEVSTQKPVKKILTDITFSKRRNPWINDLSIIIGENYCCQAFRSYIKGKQTQTIGFIGLEDDISICISVFQYAITCIQAGIKNLKKEYAAFYSWYVKQQCDSYGYGFATGIDAAFRVQDTEHPDEWGLVLALPKEVQESAQSLEKRNFKAKAEDDIDSESFEQGYEEGRQFDPSRKFINEQYKPVPQALNIKS